MLFTKPPEVMQEDHDVSVLLRNSELEKQFVKLLHASCFTKLSYFASEEA